MASIKDRIKLLRISHNLTQEQFGNLFGLVKSTISLYESGKSNPDDDIKLAICKYFHVSVDYLLGRVDTPNGNNNSNSNGKISIAEATEILRKKFVEHGIIKEGEDITEEQLDDYLQKLSVVLRTFKD